MAYSQLPHRLRMFLRLVCHVPVEVVIQQALIRAEQERAGAARRVQDAKALQLLRALPRDGDAHRVFDDVGHNIGGGVIDPTRLFDFRLFLDFGLVRGG